MTKSFFVTVHKHIDSEPVVFVCCFVHQIKNLRKTWKSLKKLWLLFPFLCIFSFLRQFVSLSSTAVIVFPPSCDGHQSKQTEIIRPATACRKQWPGHNNHWPFNLCFLYNTPLVQYLPHTCTVPMVESAICPVSFLGVGWAQWLWSDLDDLLWTAGGEVTDIVPTFHPQSIDYEPQSLPMPTQTVQSSTGMYDLASGGHLILPSLSLHSLGLLW